MFQFDSRAQRTARSGVAVARIRAGLTMCALAALLSGCVSTPRPGTLAPRRGDEIVVAGQFVHTGTKVVLWMDPDGYDAYRVERRFAPVAEGCRI